MSVAGLHLGESLRLPKCKPDPTSGDVYGPRTCLGKSVGLLFESDFTLLTGEGEEAVAIHLAKDQCPDEVLSCHLDVATTTKGGVLRALAMSAAAKMLDHLRTKYGKPSGTVRYTCQNQYGATSVVNQYEWSLPGVHIYFASSGCGKTGSLLIETESHIAERVAASEKQEKARPKL